MPRVRRTGELAGPVGWIALAALVLRLPFVGAPVSPDEGGFLEVAGHWHAGGGALYGPYWVDRPPLLIAIYRLADLLGGITALRLIGGVAVAITVLAVGHTLTRIAGRRAGTWAALMAAALLVTPPGGGIIINGELLASPFLAIGIACAVRAADDDRRAHVAALLAGVFAVAAVLVKQNMVDVAVFAVVFGAGSVLAHRATWGLLARRAGLALVGGASMLGTTLFLAWLAGTSPGGVYQAMYPFRLQVAALMSREPAQDHTARIGRMVGFWLGTGAPLVILAFVLLGLWWLVRRPRVAPPGPLVLVAALAVLTAYDVFSIGVGGSYWLHYVIQLVFPTAAMAGLLAARLPRLGRGVVLVALVVSTYSWGSGIVGSTFSPGPVVGGQVAKVAHPHDTLVSLLGDGSVVYSSGLYSPYTYLWSLPARVRDPGFTQLSHVLAGPRAPTWVVIRGQGTVTELRASAVGAPLGSRYHLVNTICQRRIFLRDGVVRKTPRTSPHGCYLPLVALNHHASQNTNDNLLGGNS